MRWYHPVVFIALLFWQAAPRPQPDRYYLSVLGGAGQFEEATFDCDGRLVSSTPIEVHDVGARLDVLSNDGALMLSVNASRSSEHYASGPTVGPRTVVGARVALEGRHAGFGFGLQRGLDGSTEPSAYLRLGARPSHLQIDVRPPTETPELTGVARLGVGFNDSFAGLAFGRDGQTTAQADLALPMARRIDLMLRGYYGPGHGTHHYGAAGGLRVHW